MSLWICPVCGKLYPWMASMRCPEDGATVAFAIFTDNNIITQTPDPPVLTLDAVIQVIESVKETVTTGDPTGDPWDAGWMRACEEIVKRVRDQFAPPPKE